MKRKPQSEETFETKSVRGTIALGRKLAKRFKIGDCVGLQGQLGAGKTVLVKGIAEGLGLEDRRLVSSPTFVLVQEYPCDVPLYHVDLYRLSEPSGELAELGLDEMLTDGIALIEWADRATGALPQPRWEIDITITGSRSRSMTLRRIE